MTGLIPGLVLGVIGYDGDVGIFFGDPVLDLSRESVVTILVVIILAADRALELAQSVAERDDYPGCRFDGSMVKVPKALMAPLSRADHHLRH